MVTYGFRESASNEDLYGSDKIDLHGACAIGDITLVRAFMGACKSCDLFKERDNLGRAPLRVAIDHDQCEIASLLLSLAKDNNEDGVFVDVNARDDHGWTAMASACAFIRNEAVLRSLVDAGADLDWRDQEGISLYDLAKSKKNETAASFLEKLNASCATKDEIAGDNGKASDEAERTETNECNEQTLSQTQIQTNENATGMAVCSICETSVVDVTLSPCEHRTCDECSRRWKRCHVTLTDSICGIACGCLIGGRRKILTFHEHEKPKYEPT